MPDFTDQFYAHSGSGPSPSSGDWQPLRDHLRAVAEGAARRACAACPTHAGFIASAEVAGWLHDLGKYREGFQLHIRGLPADLEATWHKQAGTVEPFDAKNHAVALAVLGHHGGIPDSAELEEAIVGESGREAAETIREDARRDCPPLAALTILKLSEKHWDREFLTRMILSCLVDADWSDTREHELRYKRLPADSTPLALNPAARLQTLLKLVGARAERCPDPKMKSIRAEILDACLIAADGPCGLLTLTVPTGGGKTLSGLAFALGHAAVHGKRRVIYVAPYTSIIDQNTKVIREALTGSTGLTEAIFEHYSLSEPIAGDFPDETQRAAAARRAENWDAPVIVTTNVQFFESLFANTPSRCRKLHNVANSVILLDECQTLPPELVAPTCQMLKQLVEKFGCTIVFCTATQPAFDHELIGDHRLASREIAPPEMKLFERLRRVRLEWPESMEAVLTWSEVAGRMREVRQALCIVNTRRAARELAAEFPSEVAGESLFHLSTGMCPAHRVAVLNIVRARLKAGKKCHLVSTQLIEAGVDVDFPLVLREMAPLESIIQAAGRCNREGLLGDSGGRTVVFRSAAAVSEPRKYYPPDLWYKAGRQTLETVFLAGGRQPKIDDPEDIRLYYRHLYWTGDLDPKRIVDSRKGSNFEKVASAYKLIEDDTVPLVISSWVGHESVVEELLEELKRRPNRASFRALAPWQVQIRRHKLDELRTLIAPVGESIDLRIWHGEYDDFLGLLEVEKDGDMVI